MGQSRRCRRRLVNMNIGVGPRRVARTARRRNTSSDWLGEPDGGSRRLGIGVLRRRVLTFHGIIVVDNDWRRLVVGLLIVCIHLYEMHTWLDRVMVGPVVGAGVVEEGGRLGARVVSWDRRRGRDFGPVVARQRFNIVMVGRHIVTVGMPVMVMLGREVVDFIDLRETVLFEVDSRMRGGRGTVVQVVHWMRGGRGTMMQVMHWMRGGRTTVVLDMHRFGRWWMAVLHDMPSWRRTVLHQMYSWGRAVLLDMVEVRGTVLLHRFEVWWTVLLHSVEVKRTVLLHRVEVRRTVLLHRVQVRRTVFWLMMVVHRNNSFVTLAGIIVDPLGLLLRDGGGQDGLEVDGRPLWLERELVRRGRLVWACWLVGYSAKHLSFFSMS